jgi:hypothetical protein
VSLTKLWSLKERQAYDKIIKHQIPERGRDNRREIPLRVACPHRLTFAFDRELAIDLEAEHLVVVCAGEGLSDWAGDDAKLFGGPRGKLEYEYATRDLRSAWSALVTALDHDQHLGAPASSALFRLVLDFLARRYDRLAAILQPGRVREEILANVARQLAEIRVYFDTFNRSLADRCARRPYAEQAHYACSRYSRLLTPVVNFLLDDEHTGDDRAPARGGFGGAGGGASLGGGGASGAPALTSPPAARRKLGNAFADGPGAGAAPAHPPPSSSGPGPGGWPGQPSYSSYPAVYYPPTGAGFVPPTPGPAVSPTVAGGAWSGYSGPISGSPGAAASTSSPAATPSPAAAKVVIKSDPGAPPPDRPAQSFLSQPQHVYVTGVGYNAVPAGECRQPPCGCGAKHGPTYRPGPHATWDCPFRYMQRYGSCPGFLPTGHRDPSQWNGDALTRRAKDEWVKLIVSLNLPLPTGGDYRPANFSA